MSKDVKNRNKYARAYYRRVWRKVAAKYMSGLFLKSRLRCGKCGRKRLYKFFFRTNLNKCRDCITSSDKRWRRKNKKLSRFLSRRWHLKKRFGITMEQEAEMRRRQNGKCAICRINPIKGVDHCHKTGRVRGLLCGTCNTGIGHFKDDIKTLKRAIKYLETNR